MMRPRRPQPKRRNRGPYKRVYDGPPLFTDMGKIVLAGFPKWPVSAGAWLRLAMSRAPRRPRM